MARKKKTVSFEPITDEQLDAAYTGERLNEINAVGDALDTTKYDNVVAAAKELIRLYTLGHTITNYNSYRYPGLKELVIAIEAL